jgi:hypothetical protein
MSGKYFLFGRRPKSPGNGQPVPPRPREERLTATLASLRRLGDYTQNPLPLSRAIDRVSDAAEVYCRWRENGAIIRDVILRLSDGSEIKVNKDMPSNTNMFGYCLRTMFPPGSVLNVYKGADQEFPEVLLYSVDLDLIPTEGETFTMRYENGQMLRLKIEPSLARQFQISVDYTMSGDVVTIPPPRARRPFARLSGVAQSAVLFLKAATLLVLGASLAVMAWQKFRAEQNATGGARETLQAVPTNQTTPMGDAGNAQARQSNSAGLLVSDLPGAPNPQLAPQQLKYLVAGAGGGGSSGPSSGTPSPDSSGNRRQAGPWRSAPAAAPAPVKSNDDARADWVSPIPIYVVTWTGEKTFDERVEKLFADALARMNRFTVLTGNDAVPRFYYEVNIWFQQTAGCGGTIYYELHDPEGEVERGAQNCGDIRQGRLMESVSRLAKDVSSKIDDPHPVSTRLETKRVPPPEELECVACHEAGSSVSLPSW